MYVDDSGDRILQGKLIRLCRDFSTLRTSKPLLQVCSVVVDRSLYIGHLANPWPPPNRCQQHSQVAQIKISKCSMLCSGGVGEMVTNSVLI